MSLQVNLSSKDIPKAYQDIVNSAATEWAILTYEGGTNDLKVQAISDDGLDGLTEEFYDGRIQYAFARVIVPNVKYLFLIFLEHLCNKETRRKFQPIAPVGSTYAASKPTPPPPSSRPNASSLYGNLPLGAAMENGVRRFDF